jgi:hypothetical protein
LFQPVTWPAFSDTENIDRYWCERYGMRFDRRRRTR